jgi:hypothetical protein
MALLADIDVDQAVAQIEGDGFEVFWVVVCGSQAMRQICGPLVSAASRQRDAKLGFLFRQTAAELLAAAAAVPQHPEVGLVESHPWARSDALVIGARANPLRPGAASEVEARVAQLEAPAELLFITGHSNGEHIGAGPALICRQPDVQAAPDELGLSPCFHGHKCPHARVGLPYIGASRLGAKRIVVLSCGGILLEPGRLSTQYTFGYGLQASASVRALIVTFRAVVTLTPADEALAYYLVHAGLSFGQVANMLNRNRIERALPPDFVCLGDPETAIRSGHECVSAVPSGQREWTLSLPSKARSRDVHARLPQPLEPGYVLVSTSPTVLTSAAFYGGNDIYVTLGTEEREISLRAEEESSVSGNGCIETLYGELASLTQVLGMLQGSPSATGATREAEVLRALMQIWPLRDFTAAGIVDGRLNARLWSKLRESLDTIGGKTALAYCELALRGGTSRPLDATDKLYDWQSPEQVALPACECGAPTEERHLRTRVGAFRRNTRICESCGVLADGVPHIGAKLETAPIWRPGRPECLKITCFNPHSVGLTAHIAGCLYGFADEASVSRVEAVPVGPRQEQSIELSVAVPKHYGPGSYKTGAVVVLGGALTSLALRVHLRREQQADSPEG